MKNKIINLFGNNQLVQNHEVEYAKLLEQLLEPFEDDFVDYECIEDIFGVAIRIWNLANMKNIIPKEEFNKLFSSTKSLNEETKLIKKMVDYKVSKFNQYNHFIVDFDIKEENGEQYLKVVTQDPNTYLQEMVNDHSFDEENFEENYIDRYAIILKPRQPFLDWVNKWYSDEELTFEVHQSNVYLVNDDIDDLEKWLIKRFDKIFMIELSDWNSDKKNWPKNRNYKLFKEWFDVSISNGIYDLEKKPVIKES